MTNGANHVSVLRSFAYLGAALEPACAPLSEAATRWPFKNAPPRMRAFLAHDAIGTDWRDPAVGWGLVLPDDPGLSIRARAEAHDAPEPIRELLRRRPGATVLRYRADSDARARLLWDATNEVDVSIASSPAGVSAGCLPQYLLIYAGPDRVPWSIQFALNVTRCVGRLDLNGEALENYVSALLSGWVHVPPPAATAVVWATQHGPSDATAGGRNLIAQPFVRRLREDERFKAEVIFLDGEERATSPRLLQALRCERPGTIVTSSNGNFAGLEDSDGAKDSIGSPVDQEGTVLDWRNVLSFWDPCGAVWYANASYSAGVDDAAPFDGLVDPESPLGRSLGRRNRIPVTVAPMARALLGAKRPLRAFVGHVGPLLQTSLLADDDLLSLTATLVAAVAAAMVSRAPIASFFATYWYSNVPLLYAKFDEHVAEFNANSGAAATLIRDLLTVFNVERTVILGDPTVSAQATVSRDVA